MALHLINYNSICSDYLRVQPHISEQDDVVILGFNTKTNIGQTEFDEFIDQLSGKCLSVVLLAEKDQTQCESKAQSIDYSDFVTLTEKHKLSISWY